jgi:hypothetical protein
MERQLALKLPEILRATLNRRKRFPLAIVTWLSSLLLVNALPCLGAQPGGPSGVGISIAPTKASFDMGERATFVLEITNMTAGAVVLPVFDAAGKVEDEKILRYLKAHLLEIEVRHGTNVLAMNTGWDRSAMPAEGMKYHSVSLEARTAIRDNFSLTRNWHPSFFTITNPGEYTASVTFDTRSCREEGILKGVWNSPPATFRIVPFPEFRPRAQNESPEDYAQARANFYLKRIVQHQGEYFANVGSILRAEASGAALIGLMDSPERDVAVEALSLLRQIHHRLGAAGPQSTPASKADWMTWWKETGSRIPAQELLANFDSHFQ